MLQPEHRGCTRAACCEQDLCTHDALNRLQAMNRIHGLMDEPRNGLLVTTAVQE